MTSIRYADTLFSSKDSRTAIRVMTFPDLKRPVLFVEGEGMHRLVAHFQDEDDADLFIGAFESLVRSWVE